MQLIVRLLYPISDERDVQNRRDEISQPFFDPQVSMILETNGLPLVFSAFISASYPYRSLKPCRLACHEW